MSLIPGAETYEVGFMCVEQIGFALMQATVRSTLTTNGPEWALQEDRHGTEGASASTATRERPVPGRLPRVLFVYPFPATFIKRDMDALQTFCEVTPRSPVRLAYLGVDADLFRPAEKEDLVVTVAQISRENVLRKGLRTFVDAAKEVPDVQFIIIGRHLDDAIDQLRAVAPSNVRFLGEVSDSDLREILGRARVYVQASYTEGFGVALAEAMASGCVPIVTRRGAIPEVVGETGLYVDYGDSHELANAIREGLRSRLGAEARARILDRFTITRRLDTLRTAVLSLTEDLYVGPGGKRGD